VTVSITFAGRPTFTVFANFFPATLRFLSCPMAKHGTLQTFLEYTAARSLLTVLGVLPVRFAISVGRFIGWIAYSTAADLRRTGQTNLRLAFPEKDESEREQMLRDCFASLGRELGLFGHFTTSSRETLLELIEPEGLEYLERAKAQGKGVILFTAHLGAWELTAFGLSLLGHPLSFLARRIDNPRVEGLIDKGRIRFGNRTIDKLSAGRPMVKILRSGEVLGLLLDLNTLDDEAIFVDFFGVPASTNFMVAKLALRTESPIVPIFAPWDPSRRKFQLQLQPPVAMQVTGDEDQDVRRLTEQLSMVIEEAIRRYPGQWLWVHKRWKTRPPGKPGIY
jgi:KDO2-lipid IV(A) lauroyltransferase